MAGVKGRSGGARPNSGGARPNPGPKPVWKKAGFPSKKQWLLALSAVGKDEPGKSKNSRKESRKPIKNAVSQEELELIHEIRKAVSLKEQAVSDKYFAKLLKVPVAPEYMELIDTKRIHTLVKKYIKRNQRENH